MLVADVLRYKLSKKKNPRFYLLNSLLDKRYAQNECLDIKLLKLVKENIVNG